MQPSPLEVEAHVHSMRSSKLLKSIPETVPTLSTCGDRILFPVVRECLNTNTKIEDDCEDDIYFASTLYPFTSFVAKNVRKRTPINFQF